MSCEQFYDERCDLTIAYQKAYRLQRERVNFDSYIQASYIRDALINVSPMFNPMTKKEQLDPWLKEPYNLWESDQKPTISEEEKEEKEFKAVRGFMESFSAAWKAQHPNEDKESSAENT